MSDSTGGTTGASLRDRHHGVVERGGADAQLWLLLGVGTLQRPVMRPSGLLGAILYGVAFTYFAFSALHVCVLQEPNYEALWQQLGMVYTGHGTLMVIGGLLFGSAAWRERQLPKTAVALLAAGLCINALLSLLPTPDILQILGSAVRNAGLVMIGLHLWRANARGQQPMC